MKRSVVARRPWFIDHLVPCFKGERGATEVISNATVMHNPPRRKLPPNQTPGASEICGHGLPMVSKVTPDLFLLVHLFAVDSRVGGNKTCTPFSVDFVPRLPLAMQPHSRRLDSSERTNCSGRLLNQGSQLLHPWAGPDLQHCGTRVIGTGEQCVKPVIKSLVHAVHTSVAQGSFDYRYDQSFLTPLLGGIPSQACLRHKDRVTKYPKRAGQ